MAATVRCQVIVCFCLIVATSYGELAQPLKYDILEERAPGTVVANIMEDAHISAPQPQSRQARRPAAHLPSFQILQNQSNFAIDPLSGVVTTAAILDRDVICPRKRDCSLEIDVAVYQKKGASPRLVKVIIILLDLNDNSPVFPKSLVAETVSEASPIGSLLIVTPADDLDSPANGIVRYRLEPDSSTFELQVEIEEGFRDIRLALRKQLDREKRNYYDFRIYAIDGGSTPRSGSINVLISVEDVNDNAPIFTNASYRVEIWENTPPQHQLTTVSAMDADADVNGRVTYAFSPATAAQFGSNFSVGHDSGVVLLLAPIDYERTKQVVLEVVAVDGGELPLPATARVTVVVKDVNDNAPEIQLEKFAGAAAGGGGGQGGPPQSQWVLHVEENSGRDRHVAVLVVTDEDSGENGRVECSLSSPQFRLNQINDKDFTVVTSGAIIDREVAERHHLNVTCSDRGSPRRYDVVTIVVVVDDVNDNRPMFTREFYNFSIEENNGKGAYVGQVTATDADKERNGEVEYRIVSGDVRKVNRCARKVDVNATDWFSIDKSTGAIRAEMRFDREKVDSFRLLVNASDRAPNGTRRHSVAIVNVTVLDQDDEGPQFTLEKYVFEVTDNVPSLTIVGQVTACDPDQPPRNHFTFYVDKTRPPEGIAAGAAVLPSPRGSIDASAAPEEEEEDQPEMLFGVNVTSGVVYTRERVRGRRSTYAFTVVVVESGGDADPPRTDRAVVIVNVTEPSSLVRDGGGGRGVPLADSGGGGAWWWRNVLKGLGLPVVVGAITGSVVVVALVCVCFVVAMVRRRRRKEEEEGSSSSSKEAIRSASFWSNPDALTPPPPGGGGGGGGPGEEKMRNDVYVSRRRAPSSSTDDVSDDDVILPNGNPDLQCHWCSSTDLDMPEPPGPIVVYDPQMAVPGDIMHPQNLGNCGFRPIGDVTNGHWRDKYMTSTPPSEYRKQPYSTNSSPMHMASMYQIKHSTNRAGGGGAGGGGGGGGGSGTLERRTVRFQGNADNDFRWMYGDPVAPPAYVTNGNGVMDFPPPPPMQI